MLLSTVLPWQADWPFLKSIGKAERVRRPQLIYARMHGVGAVQLVRA